ncbi:hypothetical protein [Mucilaginibacter paludis]|uniref:Lipocalin-like domain-containing protein n=1 Tax=Mucilaginibacter paludis DSM 18603 TaxID=714943 RepID=H1Y3B2_9SPHI|nr:hypothetical protein [Mucilaginibacter paludis]EHQ29267.1 hypothetical protein Mucpa_5192 [Mucilaginibacter paludis DSM 18603]
MHKRFFIIYSVLLIVATSACNRVIKPDMLIGKWNYVKVENPYSPNPPDTVSARELAEKSPYIELTSNGKLVMMWGGKLLSSGTYQLDKDNIIYTEHLANEQTRKILFWIKAIDENEIVFETKEDDIVRVRAKKDKK